MENKIEGKVTRLKQNPRNYFITVNSDDYSGYSQAECKVGDTVKFDYKQSGDYKNIGDIEIIDAAAPAPPPISTTDDRTKDIHKQVCLKIAGNIIGNLDDANSVTMDVIADQVVELGEKIQKKAWKE